MTGRRLALLPLVAVIGALVAVVLVGAPVAPARTAARPARLAVGVEVLRFAANGRRLTATGLVTATITDDSGHRRTTHAKVAMIASTGSRCSVLHLTLNKLTLSLLGLHAQLDKVVLDITGNQRGGVLGSLFCRLAKARVASARAASARALTAAVRKRGHVLRFNADIHPVASASASNPTCQVLDLVVGPLNLQLLGLVVNLNQVHLAVTATRGQGALGDLFCKLADNSPTTTTSSTTTSSTTTT